jgi:SAM-dependent methyltransferase
MSQLTEDEKATKSSYDGHAKDWAKYFDDAGGWPKQLAKFKELLPKGKVLEIGAGTGRDAKDLISLGYEYVGTDISDELLKVARSRMPNQIFIQQSVYDLSASDKFDGFWASAMLLHIPKSRINDALQQIKSVLKPNAIGFISIKDGDGEKITNHNFENGEELERLFTYWSKEEFTKVLRDNDFEVLDYDYKPISEKTNWHLFIVKNHGKNQGEL